MFVISHPNTASGIKSNTVCFGVSLKTGEDEPLTDLEVIVLQLIGGTFTREGLQD